MEEETKPTLVNKVYCHHGGKAHKAYEHHNRGAVIFWCKKHGVLASLTDVLCGTKKSIAYYNSRRQMNDGQYYRFVTCPNEHIIPSMMSRRSHDDRAMNADAPSAGARHGVEKV